MNSTNDPVAGPAWHNPAGPAGAIASGAVDPTIPAPNPRTPGIEQHKRLREAVHYHPTIHHDPFAPPKVHRFNVGDIPCSIVIRNWRDKPSYDPKSLDLPHGVQLDEVEPGWSDVNYDTLRDLLFSSADGNQFTSVRFRLDW